MFSMQQQGMYIVHWRALSFWADIKVCVVIEDNIRKSVDDDDFDDVDDENDNDDDRMR